MTLYFFLAFFKSAVVSFPKFDFIASIKKLLRINELVFNTTKIKSLSSVTQVKQERNRDMLSAISNQQIVSRYHYLIEIFVIIIRPQCRAPFYNTSKYFFIIKEHCTTICTNFVPIFVLLNFSSARFVNMHTDRHLGKLIPSLSTVSCRFGDSSSEANRFQPPIISISRSYLSAHIIKTTFRCSILVFALI